MHLVQKKYCICHTATLTDFLCYTPISQVQGKSACLSFPADPWSLTPLIKLDYSCTAGVYSSLTTRILLLTSLWWYTAGHCWRVPVFSTGITPGRKDRLTQYPESTLLIHRCISAGLKNPSSLSWPCLKTVIRTRTGIFKREGYFYCFTIKL